MRQSAVVLRQRIIPCVAYGVNVSMVYTAKCQKYFSLYGKPTNLAKV